MRQCWCGADVLEPFSPGYMLCPACGTLVSRGVRTENYGSDYWFGHQEADLGQPSIETRARADMPERCVHWLRLFLRACLPPGEVLELGCAHGGFTALLSRCGFSARGLELDADVAALATRTFGVTMLSGPLEEQDIATGSLKAVVLMDVLEHLPDPVGLLRHAGRLLAPGGVVFVQTPRLPLGTPFEEMQAGADPFTRMLLPAEHLYLFSEQSVRGLFALAGMEHLRFEQALFPYDMLFAAGSASLPDHSPEEAARALCRTPDGRLALALMDMGERAARAEAEAARASGAAAAQQGGLEGVVREMASGWVSEARLPGLVNKILLRLGRLAWLYNKAVKRVFKGGGGRLPAASRGLEGAQVLVDLTPVLPGGDNGGAKLMTILLLHELRAMRPDWRFVCLVSDAAFEELAHLDAPNVERVRASSLGRAKGIDSWRGKPVDLLFCPFTMPYFEHPSVPVVSVVYDLQYAYHPRFFAPDDEASRERTFLAASRAASRLVCISEFTRRTVLEQGNVPEGRTATVHISLPRRLARADAQAVARARERFGLGGEGYFLYPANFWAHKNHRALLEAFASFAATGPGSGMRLVLTGADTGLRAQLAEEAARKGLGGRVAFPGYVSDEELSALMTGATALVFPSLFEGFGMPLVEAMAVGTPILCSNTTSLPEVGGDAALYFDPAKPEEIARAMARIVGEPGLAEALAKKGRRRLAVFGGPEDMARKYLGVFEEVLARPLSQSTAVRGLYGDGWCGGRLFVAFGPAAHRQWLRAKFSLPPEAPTGRVTVSTLVCGKAWGKPVALSRGGSVMLDPDLPSGGGYVEFVLDGARRADAPDGPGVADTRRLSARCLELRLTDGARDVDLRYPEGNGEEA